MAYSSDEGDCHQQLLRVNLFTSKQIKLHFMPCTTNLTLLTWSPAHLHLVPVYGLHITFEAGVWSLYRKLLGIVG